MPPAAAPGFDFDAYLDNLSGKRMPDWLDCYADDAEWIEYKPSAPPRHPVVMRGRAQIGAFLARVAGSPMHLVVEDALRAGDLAAYRLTVTFPNGDRVIEQVMLRLANGRITRQVDVEAWDEGPAAP